MFFAILFVFAVGSVSVYSSPAEEDNFQIIQRQIASNNVFLNPSPLEDNDKIPILGKRIVSIGQFPYQVSLQVDINTHICDGSIIGTQWILTLASCVYKEQRKKHAVVGTNNIKTGEFRYRIAKVIVHPQFTFEHQVNDIALLKLSERIVFNRIIKNVYLPYSMIQQDRLNMTLSGWSTTKSSLSDYLQYVNLTTIPLRTCKKLLPNYSVNQSTNICTLSISGQKVCSNQDMGSPLVYNNTQYGILAIATPCALNKPNVYTNVAAFRFWIYSITGI